MRVSNYITLVHGPVRENRYDLVGKIDLSIREVACAASVEGSAVKAIPETTLVMLWSTLPGISQVVPSAVVI